MQHSRIVRCMQFILRDHPSFGKERGRGLRFGVLRYIDEDISPYLPHTLMENEHNRRFRCPHCDNLDEEPGEYTLHSFKFEGEQVSWQRVRTHLNCVENLKYGEELYFLNPYEYVFDFVEKRDASAQALLLLQELGLPWDMAWSIAAIAYWILGDERQYLKDDPSSSF